MIIFCMTGIRRMTGIAGMDFAMEKQRRKRKTGLSAEPVGGIYHCKAHVSADGSAAEIQGGVDGLFGG